VVAILTNFLIQRTFQFVLILLQLAFLLTFLYFASILFQQVIPDYIRYRQLE
jgi:hypothetical protein